MIHVLAYDVGTTGLKTCLFRIDDGVELLQEEYEDYSLYILENGGAEQDTEEWWEAMCRTTRRIMTAGKVRPESIDGIAFSSQMQGLVLVDREGRALRRPMSYMDQRAGKVMHDTQDHGITVAGVNIRMLLKSLRRTTAASTSVKDPLWKYKWVQANEPEIYEKIYKWLDVKEYLICRMTGEFVMTPDSAYATFLYDSRSGHEGWSDELCRMYGVKREHLPDLVECTQAAGVLTPGAAEELGLVPGISVYGSGGDATLIGVGAGATGLGDTHIYWGTSGWVGTVIPKQTVDINAMIAGIVSAQEHRFNYFAEMETAGKCYEWAKKQIAQDGLGYADLNTIIGQVEPGAGGVIFTPWLHGNRCPFEDPHAAGVFLNLKLDTTRAQLLRAVLEGVCYHLRWMLECEDKKIQTSGIIRFVGGGALSGETCQMLADITGRTIETVNLSKDVGSIGAALLVAVDHKEISDLSCAKELIPVKDTYQPKEANRSLYEKQYQIFKSVYRANRKIYRKMNG